MSRLANSGIRANEVELRSDKSMVALRRLISQFAPEWRFSVFVTLHTDWLSDRLAFAACLAIFTL